MALPPTKTPAPAWVEDALSGRPPILTPEEVMAVLRVSRRTVGRMVAEHRIQGVHIGGQLRIPRETVRDYLAGLGTI